MKIRIYIPEKNYNKLAQQNMSIGKDKSGIPYYMIDAEHIMPHEEFSRESLEYISWNNVDVNKTLEVLSDE